MGGSRYDYVATPLLSNCTRWDRANRPLGGGPLTHGKWGGGLARSPTLALPRGVRKGFNNSGCGGPWVWMVPMIVVWVWAKKRP